MSPRDCAQTIRDGLSETMKDVATLEIGPLQRPSPSRALSIDARAI